MKILLSFSGEQFRPQVPSEAQPLWGTSANVLARALYESLSALGEVTYIDHDEVDRVRSRHFDLFMGIVKRFDEISEACDADSRILFAVNMHPATRNDLLLDFMARERLPYRSIGSDDLVGSIAEIETALDRATCVLGVGNSVTCGSYLEHGIPAAKLGFLNYATRAAREPSRPPGSKGTTFLYAAHQLGLRQGFDIVCSSFRALAESRRDWRLVVLGRPANAIYERKLSNLQRVLGDRLIQHDWLAPASPEYDELLAATDFVFYPAIEAGQSGNVLDPLSRGAIPIISDRAGVDFAPLGHSEVTLDARHNKNLLLAAVEMDADARRELREQGLAYYRARHEGFQRRLSDVIRACLNGDPLPATPTRGSGDPAGSRERLTYRVRRRYLFARFRIAARWKGRLRRVLRASASSEQES